tara:strand:+ start:1017 stop:1304 length:288 start_codon:yes stop_codon:yes gene_type:complete
MLVELVEIKKDSLGNYALHNVYVNPLQIVFLTENRNLKQALQEGKMNLGLNQEFTSFTNIRMNNHDRVVELIVVGDPRMIEQKIFTRKHKQLLKG